MSEILPRFDQVQSIYDEDHTSNFLDLFLDHSLLYSCAFFQRDDMSLEEAQLAKLDLTLGKCDLQRGQTLLEVGSGWGAGAFHAASKYHVNVITLTLSRSQKAYCEDLMSRLPSGSGRVEVRLQGWEQFTEPVDRIVSIAAFEHFGLERHSKFFRTCREMLPSDGRLVVHSGTCHTLAELAAKQIPVSHENVLFMKFMKREIFPGGELPSPTTMVRQAKESGFVVERVHSLQSHYARTLDIWADRLASNRREAIRRKSAADYDRYMRYLTGCADHYRSGHLDLLQLTCRPA